MTAAGTTTVAAHDRHLPGPDGQTRVVHVRGHVREVPAWLFETGPLPMLDRPSAAELPPLDLPETSRVAVPAPRCPHGSFARWAARNCCAPNPQRATPPGGVGAAGNCGGHTTAGGPCGRRTTRRDRHDRPACHDHGGRPTP